MDSERRVLRLVGRAMGMFSMVRPGDRIAVGVSGGKDSLCLLGALAAFRARAPHDYDLVAVTLDQGKFTAAPDSLERAVGRFGVEWVLRQEPRTLSLVRDRVSHGCDVCSRNRRGALYEIAAELGCTSLALGHTADDCAEALFRNVMFNGRLASLPPVSASRKGPMRLIRPLVFVSEELTRAYVRDQALESIGCVCAEKPGPRSEIRAFIEQVRDKHPDVLESTSAALTNVQPYGLFDSMLRKAGADAPLHAGAAGRSASSSREQNLDSPIE